MLTTAMVLSPEDCATFARPVLRTGGWDDASSGCPAPPDPTAGSRWNVGRTAPCHGTPDPPWSSTHQPTINQSAPKLQTTNPSPLHNLHFQPYIFPMLRLVLIKHLGKYHWSRWTFSTINHFVYAGKFTSYQKSPKVANRCKNLQNYVSNIARGTMDPGYWVSNLNYISYWPNWILHPF